MMLLDAHADTPNELAIHKPGVGEMPPTRAVFNIGSLRAGAVTTFRRASLITSFSSTCSAGSFFRPVLRRQPLLPLRVGYAHAAKCPRSMRRVVGNSLVTLYEISYTGTRTCM